MKKELDLNKINELGLARVEAYIPVDRLSPPLFNQEIDKKANEQGSCSRLTDAERTDKRRKKLASIGLAQCNVITPDSQEVRGQLMLLAKRLVQENGNWEAAIRKDPAVSPLSHELASLQVRVLRIVDLEERHRKMRTFVDFHDDLMASTGIRRLVLFLLGIIKTPFANRFGAQSNNKKR